MDYRATGMFVTFGTFAHAFSVDVNLLIGVG